MLTLWSDDVLEVDGCKPRARASLDIIGILCLLRRAGSATSIRAALYASDQTRGSHRVAGDHVRHRDVDDAHRAGDTVLGCAP